MLNSFVVRTGAVSDLICMKCNYVSTAYDPCFDVSLAIDAVQVNTVLCGSMQ